uniref:Methylenetetrahydrofolate reductase n=1 Tax=Candidatus Kentrum sp. MB TaxID=2138164 RepID=A0A450XSM9_9GAMM|nr:MAG: 5,10-methylenetetrahydrofolate reductase (NAD(P)) [Candidatus Kentron sp. MB]VFK32807.1 MAG: 5,10-methylenetetrahydrofolate reductase (NAD(P)) [Candidatus Kentron sp. MB]VFK75788.1 MAG: 5,10-methylenetetrahydrofolate reductase (NAD(P)) [Candidatus Kentron sp. MB]
MNAQGSNTTFSFEFFPPKTPEGKNNLRATWQHLSKLNPHFFSVTFGAGGSTQSGTQETVLEIQQDSGIDAAPHLSCIGSSQVKIRQILDDYSSHGVQRIVALRGDFPSDMKDPGEFRHANELVEFIRAETGNYFHIEVAAYPEFHPTAPSARVDFENFKRKVNAGANSAITQYFYNPDAYLRFMDSCERLGVDIPIVPGIMPITNYTSLAGFSQRCGAEIPRWLDWRLQEFGEDTNGLKAFGIDVVTELCQRLLEAGAPGLHFYVLNRVEPAMTIWKNLGLPGAGNSPD